MPFEISPKPQQVKPAVGPYQGFADALLAGCKVTRPCRGRFHKKSMLPWRKPGACALGAMRIGMGRDPNDGTLQEALMGRAFRQTYGIDIMCANDLFDLPREKIAEMIADLR